MARNSNGTHSLPAGNPVVSGTTISATVHINTLTDISAEITDSLSRSGKGAMTAALELADGTVSVPALSFDSDTDCGLYRIGANHIAVAIGGAKVVDITANGMQATSSGDTAVGGTSSTATGVYGLSTSGAGVWGESTSGVGAEGESVSSTGVLGTSTDATGVYGLSTNGAGVWGESSAGNAVKGEITAGDADTNTRFAFEAVRGHVKLSGGNPASTTGFTNTLTPMSLPKAWADITANGSGSVVVTSGFNIASVGFSGSNVTVAFTTAMANANYIVLAMSQSSTHWYSLVLGSRTTGGFTISGINNGAAVVNHTSTAAVIGLIVFGAQ